MKKFLRRLSGLLVVSSFLFASPVSSLRLEAADASNSLQACVAENGKLAVLMLIDESKSLKEVKDGGGKKPGNDPTDSRVPALSAVVRILATAVESSKALDGRGDRSLEVQVGISGFGSGYTERLQFKELNEQSVNTIADALEAQRENDTDLHTRYHTALSGALKTFDANDYTQSPEVCRLLVWFSDGEHDDDNAPGFTSREREEIESEICGVGGIVDQLRSSNVNIVAAGLNPDEQKLGLMRLIAEGGSGYKSAESTGRQGQVSVSVDRCGELDPNGRYALATDADQIVDKLFEVLDTLPGIPQQSNELDIPQSFAGDCPAGSGKCNSVEFQVDESIASFQILVERPSTGVEVLLQTNEGQKYPVLPKASSADSELEIESIAKNTVQTRPVTARKVLISVVRKKENSIEGTWKLEFIGDGASQSRGTVNFVGVADLDLELDGAPIQGDQIRLGRFDAAPIGVRVRSKTDGSAIRDMRMELTSFQGVEVLNSEIDESDSSLFTVSKSEVERALSSSKLRQASSADLVVVPVGDVRGLRFKNGTPVPVNFGSQTFEVRVSNGTGLPSFIRTSGVLSFQGTPKQKVGLVFLGPDSGDGFVEFGEAIEGDGAKANIDLITREKCEVPQQEEVVCEIELIPDRETFDQFQVAIGVTYSAKDATQESAPGEVLLDVEMKRQPDVGRGFWAAIELLAIFLLIQGLVRLLLAYLLSRFAPLVATARRIRLDAVVDSSGALTVNPMHTNPSHNDEGFALENTDSVQTFNVFGYGFEVSVLRTFMRSTVAPLGHVSAPSTFIVGSRGYSRSKSEIDSSTGKVSLTLRGQWIVGVKSADMQSLVNGQSSVSAEVVAFLEPYEQGIGIDRGQQISDLSFGISASSFATHFVELLESERAKIAFNDVDMSSTDGGGTLIDDPFAGMSPSQADPFGMPQQLVAEPDEDVSRGRKRRKRRAESDQAIDYAEDQSTSTNEWDPFA
ncbi:MAG: VWA domain-containing protein [Actinobacteria bacterium]|nr:VWA domain-containing protein [Actinomycetota bacterium]